ncbi:flagellar basal body rod protein FlgB [Alkalimonas sp.]|uniref:flagellar basal body rod protein FlgB n=1 Tax=Alkalimonas sp. TaxID=1872453 RepID=UPI00263BD3C9|nr:flagellar basal body rod protein FlgB [Alkalimonas sp.]MCC5824991.1 flagellar basal body rod protein FlgB [Alkalimonas sp.]
MSISFKNAFGMHPDAMVIREKRTQVLAENIANADTPGFKARDIDFQQVLANTQHRQSRAAARTHEKHFAIDSSVRKEMQYRNPDQPDTGDGNSVDIHRERNLFMQNDLAYRTSLQFLDGRITSLKKAVKGQ